jgi:hypothetical protein
MMNKLQERLTLLEEQTAALVIEAQELHKEIAKGEGEDVKQAPMVDKFGRYLSEPEDDTDLYIKDEDSVISIKYHSGSTYFDRVISSGNAFNTRENAEKQVKRDQLTQRARVFMYKDQAENGVLDWTDANKRKHCVHIDGVKVFNSEFSGYRCFLTFTSDTVRTQFRKEFTDSDIKMILGVE